MASIKEINDEINAALKQSDVGPYSNYSCKTVSWDDVQRGTFGGSLSCWGSNITDTRLYAKDGRQLFTVRGDNWNERLGKVNANELALIASSIDGGGGITGLVPITLRKFLESISKFGAYANLTKDSLFDEKLDQEVSVRFQTTFLPVAEGEKQALEFAPEAYNYNTTDDENPRNIIVLCTTQGIAVQQDGQGAKKLFHHSNVNGTIERSWLEVESTSHKVGGAQVETTEEQEDALQRGKATSAMIGTRGIGTRFNVLMTIQIPLQQKRKEYDRDFFGGAGGNPSTMVFGGGFGSLKKKSTKMSGSAGFSMAFGDDDDFCFGEAPRTRGAIRSSGRRSRGGGGGDLSSPRSLSSAARVSKGTTVDDNLYKGISVKDPKRHPTEHITATIVMYYTCSGGVPSAADVKAAIDDLEELYKAIDVNGKLADAEFDFMKSDLTVKDVVDIKSKLDTQPPKPDLPLNANVFPS